MTKQNPYAKAKAKNSPSNKKKKEITMTNRPAIIPESETQRPPPPGRSNSGSKAAIDKVRVFTNQTKRDATKRGTSSAMKWWFDKFQADYKSDLFDDLRDAEDSEAEGETVISHILDFAQWLKKNHIGAQGKDKALSSDTVGQYFSQVKTTIKSKTEDLSIWANHEVDWYF